MMLRRPLLSLIFTNLPQWKTLKTYPNRTSQGPSKLAAWALLGAIFLAVQFASLFTPPLLDDVDASHAQVAQHMDQSGDWITMKLNGIRYLEKPPLPYWLDATGYWIFGQNVFATHLPNALAILGLAWLAWLWGSRGWGRRAGLYAALGVLTSIGPFLFHALRHPRSAAEFPVALRSMEFHHRP